MKAVLFTSRHIGTYELGRIRDGVVYCQIKVTPYGVPVCVVVGGDWGISRCSGVKRRCMIISMRIILRISDTRGSKSSVGLHLFGISGELDFSDSGALRGSN